MAEVTAIEWCDSTFNPVVGCTKVSAACDFCYAESWARRTGHQELWKGERRRTTEENWRKPLKWNAQAAKFYQTHGRRRRVFCASLADVFDNQWHPRWRADMWDLIGTCCDLDFLILTKRPQNIAKMLPAGWNDGLWTNVWLGTTAENQEEADRRIPHLLSVQAAVRFVSLEPLLGPIDLIQCKAVTIETPGMEPAGYINWAIVGGESGPHARPMHPRWARDLRDQCAIAGVPFFFKQWGQHRPPTENDLAWRSLGKKGSGRLLDGIEHNGIPS